jgi:hypothetical protein
MIQTECTKCGNKREFEDSYNGRKFKCPVCSSPVKIQITIDVIFDKAAAQNEQEKNDVLDLVSGIAEEKLGANNISTGQVSDVLPNIEDVPNPSGIKVSYDSFSGMKISYDSNSAIKNEHSIGLSQSDEYSNKEWVNLKQQTKKKQKLFLYLIIFIISLICFVLLTYFVTVSSNSISIGGSASSSDVYQPTQSPNQFPQADTSAKPAHAKPADTPAMSDAIPSEYVGQDDNQSTQSQSENAVTDEQSDNTITPDEDVNRRELLIARIRSFYRHWQNGSMETANYFAENVEVFFNKKDMNKSELENAVAVTFREFVNFNLDLKDISFVKTQNEVTFYRVKMHFKCFRVKMQKFEECDDTVLIGINSQNQFVYLKEEKIENLKFYK